MRRSGFQACCLTSTIAPPRAKRAQEVVGLGVRGRVGGPQHLPALRGHHDAGVLVEQRRGVDLAVLSELDDRAERGLAARGLGSDRAQQGEERDRQEQRGEQQQGRERVAQRDLHHRLAEVADTLHRDLPARLALQGRWLGRRGRAAGRRSASGGLGHWAYPKLRSWSKGMCSNSFRKGRRLWLYAGTNASKANRRAQFLLSAGGEGNTPSQKSHTRFTCGQQRLHHSFTASNRERPGLVAGPGALAVLP